jgi:hypothetical protein
MVPQVTEGKVALMIRSAIKENNVALPIYLQKYDKRSSA